MHTFGISPEPRRPFVRPDRGGRPVRPDRFDPWREPAGLEVDTVEADFDAVDIDLLRRDLSAGRWNRAVDDEC